MTAGTSEGRSPVPDSGETFAHRAVFYDSDQQYLEALVPFIRSGLASGEPVFVAVPLLRLLLLRETLGDAAREVEMVDMAEAGRNPGRILARLYRAVTDLGSEGGHVRLISEPIWSGRSELEYPACVQHEALVNTAFAGYPVTMVCPYDTAELDEAVLAEAEMTHPVLHRGERQQASQRFAPGTALEQYNQPLASVADAASFRASTVADLSQTRRFAVETARELGVREAQLDDLALVVTELVTNSLVHTDGDGVLQLWGAHDHLVCAVSDHGQITDPLAGRLPPPAEVFGGRGLLTVHAVADLVRTHTTPAGTTIQAHLRAAP